MCIIIAKPKNTLLPSEDKLRNCFDNNPDGAGYMFSDGKKVYIRKGFMTIDDLLDDLKLFQELYDVKNHAMVFHFRFATHGAKTAGNTHPFPITVNISELTKTSVKTTVALCHNGIMGSFGKTESSLSDTMFFVKTLSHISSLNKIKKELKKHTPSNKFAILTPVKMLIVGYFHKKDGCYFSNYGYETFTPVTIPDIVPYMHQYYDLNGVLHKYNSHFTGDKFRHYLDGGIDDK